MPPSPAVAPAPTIAPPADPAAVYRTRVADFARLRDSYAAQWNRMANLRLAAFVLAAVALGWGVWQGIAPLIAAGLVLLAAFFVLVYRHNRLRRARDRYAGLARLNEEAGLRLARDWDHLPVRHTATAPPGHPYAADLDLFGHASLFQLLEAVGTHLGEAMLARWLLAPAPPATVAERQPALADLAPRIDWRDELALRGRALGDPRPDPTPFLAWAEEPAWLLPQRALLWIGRVSVAVLWLLLLAQVLGLAPYPFWVVLVVFNWALLVVAGRQVRPLLDRVVVGESAFQRYADAFELVTSATFAAPALTALQSRLTTGATPAPAAMRRLHRVTGLVFPADHMLNLPIQLTTLWDLHVLAWLEGWKQGTGPHVRDWFDALGEVDALAALAVLAHDNPGWVFPTLDGAAQELEAADLGHPLLADGVRVDNDVTVGPTGTFLLVTGSNMSGKSTLLRAIGVNLVLAGAGAPVCATRFRAPPVRLWTSMRIQDSLERGVSYFMAELERLKAVVDASRPGAGEGRLFYLLDEILQGTNTAERQIAARRIILALVSRGALGAVSTHDLTLSDAPVVAAVARPIHFSERFETTPTGPTMTFDYKIRPGVATSTNALRLMEIVGLDLDESGRGG
jgi:hypothetical protein